MAFEDLREHGSEAAVKAAGKYHQKGKAYEMNDGDVCLWKSNA
jgi:obg-like ATPase 1